MDRLTGQGTSVGSAVDDAGEAERLIHLSRLVMIGELAACFAHDVSNPLMLIQGHLRLIDEQIPRDHPLRDNLRAANDASDRIGRLASRMLDFSRKPSSRVERCDISDIVDDAYRFVRPYLSLRTVSFEFDKEPKMRPVSVDRNLLVQVLINLFQNAADAMVNCPQRNLKVTAGAESDAVRIEISDTGRGIPEEDCDRVFEPFFTTKGNLGTGLGLYITRRIVVEDLKGAITVASVPPGTTFAIRLPQQPATSAYSDPDSLDQPAV